MTLDIFIPFWGEPALLFDAVASVRAQRNNQWRLTVVDDCYPDAAVAAFFAELDDERVMYLRNDENLGITDNYRRCIGLARAEHVALLGCDDLMHPDYVDVVTRALQQVPEADVVQPGVVVIDESGHRVRPLADRVKQTLLAPRVHGGVAVLAGEEMATSLIRGDWLYWPSLTFRTETLRRVDFRDGLPIIQDLALLMDIAFAGGTLVYAPELCFSYRRHGSSASQRSLLDGRRFRDERSYYAQARNLARERGWSRTARTARLRSMSRLHAITELPKVLRGGNRAGIESTLAHIFSL